MTKFTDLSLTERQCIVDYINVIFGVYHIEKDSINAFWERVDIGNKKFNAV